MDPSEPVITFLLGIVDGSDRRGRSSTSLRRDLPGARRRARPVTYLELQALAGILPFGLRHYWKGHFLRDLDADLFDRLVEALADADAVR